jgi:hypothetical protein
MVEVDTNRDAIHIMQQTLQCVPELRDPYNRIAIYGKAVQELEHSLRYHLFGR